MQVLSQVFLKTSTLCAVTPEVTELKYCQPEDNHETRIAESEKV